MSPSFHPFIFLPIIFPLLWGKLSKLQRSGLHIWGHITQAIVTSLITSTTAPSSIVNTIVHSDFSCLCITSNTLICSWWPRRGQNIKCRGSKTIVGLTLNFRSTPPGRHPHSSAFLHTREGESHPDSMWRGWALSFMIYWVSLHTAAL